MQVEKSHENIDDEKERIKMVIGLDEMRIMADIFIFLNIYIYI